MNNLQSIENKSFLNTSPPGDDIIHLILKAVEARVNELKQNIKVSQITLDLGVHTDLTVKLKSIVEDPITHLLTMQKDLNSTISSLLTVVVKEFFSQHRDRINKAFITDTPTNNQLHFSIVLKEDSYENRSVVFSLLREYKYTSLWESYPIYFQIVPENTANSIVGKEIISC